jgi:hypothetical protein
MTGAPTAVADSVLRDLGLKVAAPPG